MDEPNFKKIAVIGAGTMGSGIAAQIANAGHEVLLLDLAARDGEDKTPTEMAIDRLIASDPPQLMHRKNTALITTGTIDGDFHKLADCDWIIEAVVERLDIKKALYKRLDETIHAECIVSSNTSTIPISLLVEDMPATFRRRFAITHYFNPVRYMRLLELVRGTDTSQEVMDRLADYNDQILGKGVVRCADTPGFLGNRVGVFALQVGIDEAFRCGLTIEEADALMGRPMGIPKTGDLSTYDPGTMASISQGMVGSKMGKVVIQRDIPWMVDLYQQGRLKLDELISGRWRLEQINEAIADTKSGNARRNVILFDKG